MSLVVPAAMAVIVLFVVMFATSSAQRKKRREDSGVGATANQARVLIHSINDDRCTGCDACVAVCPTNVLDLVSNKSRVLRFQDCIQCEACMWACPTEALVMHMEGTEPPTLKLPNLDSHFQTEVPGQYLIGEVAGKPLVKNAANLGRMVIEHMRSTGLQAAAAGGKDVDVAIVGSGPGGLSAALSCKQRGYSYVLLEKESIISSTVSRYPKGKLVMAEPYDTKNLSLLPVFDSSKEEIVPLWQSLLDFTGIEVKLKHQVESISAQGPGKFAVTTTQGTFNAQRVVIATGTRGKPRTLGVPGEEHTKVNSLLEDPADFAGHAVLVVGGGDSALEATIALADAGAKVILSYRGRRFSRAQPKNRELVERYEDEKRIKVKYQSQVVEFADKTVTLSMLDGAHKRYPNSAAFILIGADPPVKWLSKLGVNFVERPHSFELGKTDELVRAMAPDAVECPQDAAGAAALVVPGRIDPSQLAASARAVPPRSPPAAYPSPERAASRPRTWLRSATKVFRVGRGETPIPAAATGPSGRGHSGRRDSLAPDERARVLRMLRDDGARMADEDSAIFVLHGQEPTSVLTPAPFAAGLTYDRPTVAAIRQGTAEPVPLDYEDFGGELKPREAVVVGLARVSTERFKPRRRRKLGPGQTPMAFAVQDETTEQDENLDPTKQVEIAALDGASQAEATLQQNVDELLGAAGDAAEDPTKNIDLKRLAKLEEQSSRTSKPRVDSLSDIDFDLD